MFSGQHVYVIGGGPSLKGFDFSRLCGCRCIAVNSAGYDAPWADVLLFHDNSWFEANRGLVDDWRGIAVTVSRHAKNAAPDRLIRLQVEELPEFGRAPFPIKMGHSSGQTAVSLAVTLGASRVILIGFDMRTVDGASHYHRGRPLYTDEHAARIVAALEYETVFKPHWSGWNDAALAAGCEILNATPGSALKEFPMVDLESVLQ